MNGSTHDNGEVPNFTSNVKKILLGGATSVWLIFFVALGARLGFGWDQERKIPRRDARAGIVCAGDREHRHCTRKRKRIQLAVREGDGTDGVADAGVSVGWWRECFRVFGMATRSSFFAVFFLNAIFSSVVCIAIFHAGKRIGGLVVASGAAWLWALFPNAVMVPFEWVWDTSLSALLGATILWATLELAESQRMRDWCAYGLLWGFTLMTNPSLGSLLPFLLGWAAYSARREKRVGIAVRTMAAAGIAFLCCVPWTVRNYVQFHRLVPLRSNFPLELYIGNNNNYAMRQFVWPPKINKEVELLRYLKMGETVFMDEEKRKAVEFIRAHPGIFVELTGERFVTFWAGLPEPVQAFLKYGLAAGSCVAGVQHAGGGGRAGGNRGADRETQRVRISPGCVSGCVSLAVLHHAPKSAVPAPDRSGDVAAGGSSCQQAVWNQGSICQLKSGAAGERIKQDFRATILTWTTIQSRSSTSRLSVWMC